MKNKIMLTALLFLTSCAAMQGLATTAVPSGKPEDAIAPAAEAAAGGNYIGAALYAAAGITLLIVGPKVAKAVVAKVKGSTPDA